MQILSCHPSLHLKNFQALLIIARRQLNLFSLVLEAHHGLASTFWSFISSHLPEFQPPMKFPRWGVPLVQSPTFLYPILLGWCLFGLKTALLSPSLEKAWLFGDSSPLCFLNSPVTSLPSHLLCCMIGTISCQSFLTERRCWVSPLYRAHHGACTQKAPSKCCGSVSRAAILIKYRNKQITTKNT